MSVRSSLSALRLKRWRALFFSTLAIPSCLFVVYGQSLSHDFLMDDEAIVLQNPLVRGASLGGIFRTGYFNFEGKKEELWKTYYRPLTSITFAADYVVWKLNSFGYNLTNFVLHAAVCLGLFYLLRRIFENTGIAFALALLYGMHPIHTEAVTYLSSRADLLSALWMLLGMLSFWERRTVWALGCYALAVFSKESALLLPAYLFWLERGLIQRPAQKLFGRLLPFAALAAAYWIFRRFYCAVPLGPATLDWRQALLRFLSFGTAFWEYFRALVFSWDFKFCLSLDFAQSFYEPKIFFTLAVLLFVLFVWLWCLKRRGALLFGYGLFLTALLPAFQIIPFKPEWAEHYLYVPAMGLAVMLGVWMRSVWSSGKRPLIFGLLGLYVVYLGFFGYRTYQRNSAYGDSGKYYERLSNSDSPYAFYGYSQKARAFMRKGDWPAAFASLEKALERGGGDSDAVHDLLGVCYFQRNSLEKALWHFEKAYQVSVTHDSRYRAKEAMTLFQMNRYEDSARVYEEIQREYPTEVSVYTNLLMIYELLERPQEAMHWADQGLRQVAGQDQDAVLLSMMRVRFLYRQGLDDRLSQSLEALSEKYPREFWYSDVVRLLRGELSQSQFVQILGSKYPGEEFASAARLYILMSLVLNGQTEALRGYLDENRAQFEQLVQQRPLYRRELERAKQRLEAPSP